MLAKRYDRAWDILELKSNNLIRFLVSTIVNNILKQKTYRQAINLLHSQTDTKFFKYPNLYGYAYPQYFIVFKTTNYLGRFNNKLLRQEG